MPTITFKNRCLTHNQWQQVSSYINTHLDRELSLIEIAQVINISPTYPSSVTLTGEKARSLAISRICYACHFELSKTENSHCVRVSEFTFEKVTEEGLLCQFV